MSTAPIRVRLVQMEVRPGRPADNAALMLRHVADAKADRVNLVVFPEMAIPGYLIADEWEREAFLRDCEACAAEVREAARGVTVIFGSVGIDWQRRNEDGRVRKYNALFVAENATFIGPACGPYDFVIKTLLPNYREFDDSRHFYDLRKLAMEQGRALSDLTAPVQTSLGALGCVLCEDAWDADYGHSPLDLLARHSAALFIDASASPYTFNKNHKRHRVFTAHARRLHRPLLYVNNTGIQNNGKTVYAFDGSSAVYTAAGPVRRAPAFEEAVLTVDLPLPASEPAAAPAEDGILEIRRALLYGTRRFMDLCGVRRVVVGVSGGIDSAVVAALYSRLLAPDDLLLVNMPGAFTSPTTIGIARALAANLGALYAEVPITASADATRRQLDGLTASSRDGTVRHTLRLSGPVMENVQARDRSARVLAACAAAFGGVFTCNANKAEVTAGYTTLYGDLGGYLAGIADLWKGEVYALAEHLNRDVFGREAIPRGALEVTPSAELSPEQNVDEKKGDPLIYPYHDCLFRSWVEDWNRTTPEEILEWYAAGTLEERIGYKARVADLFPDARTFIADLERWWSAYQGMGVAKRIQAPPVLAVKRRAFGFDHRESQMGARYTRAYTQLKHKLLAAAAG